MNKPLRFAPFIRVSTEKQENRGRSLQDQKSAITGYVKTLGGSIPESCWQYTGQESATPDSQGEKRMFNRLLQDAKKGIFDAVIVCHTDRWSRDNKKSKEGVEILKASGVRFFTGTTELDLFNPAHEMQLGVLTEFNEYAAKRLALASLLARIASAREQSDKGLSPENLRLPFARYREQDGKWALDERKAELVRAAVDLYLDAENGKGVEPISKIVGINYATLGRAFRFNLGDTWCREFKSKKFNISESVEYKIPAIIEDPAKIQAVLDKLQKNKTFTHANRKRKYLLSKFVLCAECGSSFSGATPYAHGKRYYAHLNNKRSTCIHSKPAAHVDASLLERVVISKIEDLFLSPEAIEEKVKEHCSTPVIQEKSRLLTLLENERRQLKIEIQRLMDAYAKGLFNDDEVKPMISEKRERLIPLDAEIDKLQRELENTPTEEAIKQRAINISKAVRRSITKQARATVEVIYQHERKLIESAFGGKDAEGKRLGVYIRKEDGKWYYELQGNLPWFKNQGELLNDYYEQAGLDSEGSSGNSAPSSASNKYETAHHGYICTASRSGRLRSRKARSIYDSACNNSCIAKMGSAVRLWWGNRRGQVGVSGILNPLLHAFSTLLRPGR